ncbi:hypothetical protein MgSA37_00290 [Mucilaginibacter gotjawali]|uniref:Uncharacterized protein n=2 Tax=Mucilaginibacter gotjawali TaxID=1550579 RepID=A0A839SME2_9SPHI|nr:hypothetical protein [Mucilaginibacter gotjawali]BAU52140.1 hypothetical protein MgSA37_00290 [Mucilaginibacter gotjawali]
MLGVPCEPFVLLVVYFITTMDTKDSLKSQSFNNLHGVQFSFLLVSTI